MEAANECLLQGARLGSRQCRTCCGKNTTSRSSSQGSKDGSSQGHTQALPNNAARCQESGRTAQLIPGCSSNQSAMVAGLETSRTQTYYNHAPENIKNR